ncbi:hypothetical protein [Streptomyces hydrogenans]|uniref:hypothetical protein n=1 Tax=Streptomyces hydrogenans TaxID=1873719 RepID=UPI0037F25C8F
MPKNKATLPSVFLLGEEASNAHGGGDSSTSPTLFRAAVAFGAIKAVGIAFLAAYSAFKGKDALVLLSARWDSLWYSRVADFGYGFSIQAPDGRHLSSMAFFPLLPLLEKSAGLLGISSSNAGLVISLVASLVAATGLFLLGRYVHSAKAGYLLVCLWASLPVSIVQSMAYSESLFVALSSWALYAALRERWVTAGLLAFFAGLTRPVGLAVGAAVIVAVLLAMRSARIPPNLRGNGRILFACIISPLGAVGYILWVGLRRGDPFGYFQVQAEWGNGFDGGVNFSRFLAEPIWDSWILVALFMAGIICLAALPHVILFRQGQPMPLIVYSAMVTLLAVGASGYFGSKPRLLIPAFPLLLPLAISMARSKRTLPWIVMATLVSAVYGAFWLNGSGPP